MDEKLFASLSTLTDMFCYSASGKTCQNIIKFIFICVLYFMSLPKARHFPAAEDPINKHYESPSACTIHTLF